MRNAIFATSLAVIAGVIAAAQSEPTAGVQLFNAKEMDAAQATLLAETSKGNDDDATKTLIEPTGTHRLQLHYRSKGQANAVAHPNVTDIYFIKSGGAAMQIGGQMTNPTRNGNNINGTIRGGRTYQLAAGDVLTVPANVPHQWVFAPGQSVAYYLVNVQQPGSAPPGLGR